MKETLKEDTAEKILRVACKVFAEHGFAGTSISMLAKQAEINQSLIYHHFGNKEGLWKAAKAFLLKDIFAKAPSMKEQISLEDFIHHAVYSRFEWYQEHPDIIRMLNWQRLEPKKKQLQGTAPSMVDHWVRMIPRMQRENKIRNDISAEMVIVLLTNLVVSPLFDDNRFLQSKEECKKYLEMVTKALVEMLTPEKTKG